MPATVECPTQIPGLTGVTLTAFPDGSDTAAISNQSVTEATNRKGLYTYSNSTVTGLHYVYLKNSGGNIIAWGWAVLATSGRVIVADERETALLQTTRAELAANQRIPWVTLQLSNTLGDSADITVGLHNGNFQSINIEDLDAEAIATLTVREFGSGADAVLFTETFDGDDLVNGKFEKSVSDPGFVANKLYTAEVTIEADGMTYGPNVIDIQIDP